MKIGIHAPFQVNDYLKELINEKVGKLEKIYDRFGEAEVYLKIKEGAIAPKDKEVEIKLHVPGSILFAKGLSDTFEKALPGVTQKLRRQLIKYKEGHEPQRAPKLGTE